MQTRDRRLVVAHGEIELERHALDDRACRDDVRLVEGEQARRIEFRDWYPLSSNRGERISSDGEL